MELPNIKYSEYTWGERHYQNVVIYNNYKFEYMDKQR